MGQGPPSLWQPAGLFIFLSRCLPPWGYHLDGVDLMVSKPKPAQTLAVFFQVTSLW